MKFLSRPTVLGFDNRSQLPTQSFLTHRLNKSFSSSTQLTSPYSDSDAFYASLSNHRVPKAVVFDLDMCVWAPELFELTKHPTGHDPITNRIIVGDDPTVRVECFPGALQALRDIVTHRTFDSTKIAIASACEQTDYARFCLNNFDLMPNKKLSEVIDHSEIYPGPKVNHFNLIRSFLRIGFEEMLFFDDCTWGDNCGEVSHGCPGVVCVKTPQGLTWELWKHGLEKFSQSPRLA
eukprot:GHVN01041444.1.p1 GENE.GHVN01041444.1~~GHVN01041444.1.p1  ORF type:complete len:235 (-),score=50.65 GHVN01041444.1:904-1608(-)